MINVSRNFRYEISVGVHWLSVLMMRDFGEETKGKSEKARGRWNDDKTIKKYLKNGQAARGFVRQKRTTQ